MLVRTSLRGTAVACALLALACSGGDGPTPIDEPPVVSFAPLGGAFAGPVTVTVACADDRSPCASVLCTTDGTQPTAASLAYADPIAVVLTTTLRCVGRDSAGHTGATFSQHYVIDADAPIVSASPPGGLFASPPAISLVCSDGGGTGCSEIHYTTDGAAPTRASPVHGPPIVVADGTVLRFVAFDGVGNVSAVGREEYHVDGVAPGTSASPEGTAFNGSLDVTLSCVDPAGSGCAEIHYTTDGTAATSLSAVYDGPIHVQGTTTIEFFGTDLAGNAEAPHRATYVLDETPPTTTISPPPGPYHSRRTVTLTCEDVVAGCAAIYYTIRADLPGPPQVDIDPYPGGARYTGPFVVGEFATSYTVRYASVDVLGNVEPAREARYVIDQTAPSSSASPASGTYREPVTVTLSCDDSGGAGCATIRYSTDGSDPFSSPSTATTYTAPIPIATLTTLRFLSIDWAGNASPTSTEIYTFDSSPPRVVSSSPVNGAGAADPAAPIRITFDDRIDPTSLAATVNGAAAATAFDPSSTTVTITPASPLAPDAPCAVELRGVRDWAGNTASSPITIAFRTRGEVAPFGAAGSATLVAHEVAYDAAGNAMAVYRTDSGKGRKVLYALYDAATDEWTPEVELAREGTKSASVFPIAVASRGDGFLVAWSTAGAVKARFVSADGTESADVPLWSSGASELRVATNGAGYAVVAAIDGGLWSRVWDGDPVAPLWSLPETFAAGSSVRVAAEGLDYVATFLEPPSSGSRNVMFARRNGASGWSTIRLYTTALPLGAPAIAAAAPSAGVAVAFTVQDAVGAVFVSKGTGGFMLPPVQVANAPQASNASIATSGYGFVVVWQGVSGATTTTSARAEWNGTLSPVTDLATATGVPAGTRIASNGTSYVALAATMSGGTTRVVATARPDGSASDTNASWSTPLDAAPEDASATGASILPASGAYAISFAQDDGARHALRVRAHSGAAGADALGALSGPDTQQPGTVRELRFAGDGQGGGLAVWTQVHRGGNAVVAARATHGAYAAPVVVALGADTPAVAAAADAFVVAYRRGERCEVRTVSSAGVRDATVLADGTAGACSAPAIASSGGQHVAAWRSGTSRIEAAVFDGEAWGAPQALDTGASYGGVPPDVGARPGELGVTWVAGSGGAPVFRWFGGAPPAWSSVAGLDTTGADAPRVAAGPAGFAVVWLRSFYVYASARVNGTFQAPTQLTSGYTSSTCRAPAIAAGPDGFLAAWDCGGAAAREYAHGQWINQVPLTSARSDVRVAGGARGYGLLLRDTATGALRAKSLVDHVWQATELVRPTGAAAAMAAGWDGEAYDAVWTEPDALDSTVDLPVSRRGL